MSARRSSVDFINRQRAERAPKREKAAWEELFVLISQSATEQRQRFASLSSMELSCTAESELWSDVAIDFIFRRVFSARHLQIKSEEKVWKNVGMAVYATFHTASR